MNEQRRKKRNEVDKDVDINAQKMYAKRKTSEVEKNELYLKKNKQTASLEKAQKSNESESNEINKANNKYCSYQRSRTLLSYFSKKPSEQSRQRYAGAEVTVKAEIYSTSSVTTDVTDGEKKKLSFSGAETSDQTTFNFDKICSTKSLSMKNSNCFSQKSKRKRSLQIQLQTTTNKNSSDIVANNTRLNNLTSKSRSENKKDRIVKRPKIDHHDSNQPQTTLKGILQDKTGLRKNKTIESVHNFSSKRYCKYNYDGKISDSEVLSSSLSFPKISHINQSFLKSNSDSQFCIVYSNVDKYTPSFQTKKMKTVLNLHKIEFLEDFYLCTKLRVEMALSEIESYCNNTHVMCKYQSLISEYNTARKFFKRECDIFDGKNFEVCSENYKKFYRTWTDKYAPKCALEIVGNEESVAKLKTWLGKWTLVQKNGDYSSSEEFSISDIQTMNDQAAFLVGPYGTGKTACTYAIAQELGYRVIEINASSKRSGKRIINEFKEATESYRVQKSDFKELNLSQIIQSDCDDNKSNRTLFLIEDIDLIFEEDDGFLRAMYQLASNTKIPIIFTLNELCSSLYRIAPRQTTINFYPIPNSKMIALLQIIGIIETGYKLPTEYTKYLCRNGDLRKSLLQLQYVLLSNQTIVNKKALENPSYEDILDFIYVSRKKSKKQETEKKNSQLSFFNRMVDNLDTVGMLSLLCDIKDPTVHWIYEKGEVSMLLPENSKGFSSTENLSFEIGSLIYAIIYKSQNVSFEKRDEVKRTLRYNSKCNNNFKNSCFPLSKFAYKTLDKYALSVDYFSCIRTICRIEEVRSRLNKKRGNRFFHYFQNSKILGNLVKTEKIFLTACKILQE